MKCSTPKCRRKPVLQLLGDHPICRKCGELERELAAFVRELGTEHVVDAMVRLQEMKRELAAVAGKGSKP